MFVWWDFQADVCMMRFSSRCLYDEIFKQMFVWWDFQADWNSAENLLENVHTHLKVCIHTWKCAYTLESVHTHLKVCIHTYTHVHVFSWYSIRHFHVQVQDIFMCNLHMNGIRHFMVQDIFKQIDCVLIITTTYTCVHVYIQLYTACTHACV
jgi:hypothetical protein